ncbi:WD repeat-containing protein 43-like isoform X2 [Macadamia integrifolia]|uniref:WD repeat-containing protein 43-like isoform X2 n=1 Tax=Macadamia integrifolia TaxID=60698 RepID=UPI001C4E5C73|nr:WD repeat-containing protein 43-like isoform X2 [Macadamia integrifolia]
MGGENLKSLVSSFTPEGDFLATLSPTGNVKIWNTGNGDLFAECKELNGDSDMTYSCLACSYIGKKRSKKHGTFILALGTNAGDIVAINVFTGERKWTCTGCHPGGTAGLSFANKGYSLYTVGTDGLASELDSKTGEVIQKFKVSKKPVSSFALSSDEKTCAVAHTKIRVFSLESKKEIQNCFADLSPVQYIAISDGAKAIVTSRFSEKQLQVWECDSSTKTITAGSILSMRHPPFVLDCQNSCNNRDGLVILSVSESGIAHIWELKNLSQEEANPTKIRVKSVKAEENQQKSGSAKKGRIPIIAARLQDLGKDGLVSVLIAYGSTDHPQFNLLDITNIGEDIVITAKDVISETVTSSLQENGDFRAKENSVMDFQNLESGATDPLIQKEKVSKKRVASDRDLETENLTDLGHAEAIDRLHVEDDLNEPTMGEKLARLNLLDDDKANTLEIHGSPTEAKPPSADSVHVLLKQALHADDRALLLDCLYTQDEKVIANSTSLLNPSDVLKLLESLVSMIQSRGAVLACALPWLRNLLLQQASCIMSQETSLLTLNSLYQLIESRVSTFQSALKLSSCVDCLFVGISDDVADETSTIKPVFYEDKDESDEEEPEDAMETDEESEEAMEAINGFSDFEESD